MKRRTSEIAQLEESCHFDVRSRWALRLVSWVEHMFRHKSSPSFQFLDVQTDAWLRQQMREAGMSSTSGTVHGGATNTKSGPGNPLRWCHRWVEHVAFSEEGW